MRHFNPIRYLLPLLLAALLAAGCDQSPTGRTQFTLVPESQMDALGEQGFEELLQKLPLSNDPGLHEYVGCVAQALVDALPEPHGSWSIAVFDDPAPNAFALPGGKIGVHTGMLRVARTPEQLAAVIGHEIGHVIADHANERLTQELAVQGGLMLVDLLAEDAGSFEHETLRKALGIGAEYGLLLPYSRVHEREADQDRSRPDGQGRLRSACERRALAEHGGGGRRAAAGLPVHASLPRQPHGSVGRGHAGRRSGVSAACCGRPHRIARSLDAAETPCGSCIPALARPVLIA
jgi:hypothetical protein